MKNKIYIALICAFSILLAVSSGFLIKHYIDSEKQSELYDNLIETIEKTDTEKDTMTYSQDKSFLSDYQDLYLQNNDMVGWIKIEDTKINYPVMQSSLHICEQRKDCFSPQNQNPAYGKTADRIFLL